MQENAREQEDKETKATEEMHETYTRDNSIIFL